MTTRAHSHSPRSAAFSLVEIIIAVTIVAVMTAVAVPTLRGALEEREARKPIENLQRLAKEARLRAIKERRAYQLAISAQGITASRYTDPYVTLTELAEFTQAVEQGVPLTSGRSTLTEDTTPTLKTGDAIDDPVPTGEAAPVATSEEPTPTNGEWVENYPFPEGTHVTVKFWHDSVPAPVEGESVKLWVFQPSGLCVPLKLTLESPTVSLSAEFNALTADLIRETGDRR